MTKKLLNNSTIPVCMVNIINAEVIIQLESSEEMLYIVGAEERFCVELPSSMFDQ